MVVLRALLLLGFACSSSTPRSSEPTPPAPAQPVASPAEVELPPPAEPVTEVTPTEPTWLSCQQTLVVAEGAFRAKAPKLYPPYAGLLWTRDRDPDDVETDIPQVITTPGRSWTFTARVVAIDDVDDKEVSSVGSKWTRLASRDAAFARREGAFIKLVTVETERSAVSPLSKHPLVVAYVKEMKAALDSCRPD